MRYPFKRLIQDKITGMQDKKVQALLNAYRQLSKAEQYEVRRHLLKQDIQSLVSRHWEDYPDEHISDEEITSEVKTVRNAGKSAD